MNMSYDLVLVVTNILYVYFVFLLLNTFLGGEIKNKKQRNFIYVTYFFVSAIVFLNIRIPLVTLLFNIISYFVISLCYKATMYRRIIISIFTYIIGLIIELAYVILLEGSSVPLLEKSEYDSIIALILIRVTNLIIAYLFYRYKFSLNRSFVIPKTYYFSIIFISFGSMYLYVGSLGSVDINVWNVGIGGVILIGINLLTMALDEKIYKSIILTQEKELLYQQNCAYENQSNIINQTNETIRNMNHDMKNHISMLNRIYQESGQNGMEEINQYTNAMLEKMENGVICKSYNFIIDSIVNFKLTPLLDTDVVMKVDICVPHTMNILAMDLTTILGNLLDNAVTAVVYSKEKKLDLKIMFKLGNLIITLKNSYNGKIIAENKVLKTTKIYGVGHGFGISSIKEAVAKYDGSLEIEYSSNYFLAEVIIPVHIE